MPADSNATDPAATAVGYIRPVVSDPDATVPGCKSAKTPVVTAESQVVEQRAEPQWSEPQSSEQQPASDIDPLVGTVVGKFLIESVIASGGMGTVYKALQREPVKRPVALKMIRSGMADETTVNRFLVERQTLALMDHPDIACVYEAGTSEKGNPYFAMEFCDGQPIDQYCNDRKLGVTERVQLVIRIARALQRAHARGIVHRDLKPGNVLVSDCEGRPDLKVIDFGIAKITDEHEYGDVFDNGNPATRVGEVVGTPSYMSMEQAAGGVIDARTDVFAIGAILFKLLTGTPPLPRAPEDCNSFAKIIAHIQSFEALPPTRRLKEAASQQCHGQHSQDQAQLMGLSKPSQLLGQIKGDLDWVTLRATEPDKLRRYATADDFADDLQRFLNHEPVYAAAPSRAYRLRKLFQRRRATVLAVAAITATILIASGIGVASWWHRENLRADETASVTSEVQSLLSRADAARMRAGKGGPNAQDEFADAKNAVAVSQSLLATQPTLSELIERLKQTQDDIDADESAFELARRLDGARERATRVDPANDGDAFGRLAGLKRLTDSFIAFGITPAKTPVSETARRLLACPPSVRGKLTESLDFLLNEESSGAGLTLQEQDGRISIAEIIQDGAADQSGLFRVGDRILKINDVDLIQSAASEDIRVRAYELLSAKPNEKISLRIVRDLNEPVDHELTCRGEVAHWACDVLRILDDDPWRTSLRSAVLSSNVRLLRELAESDEMNSQRPFSLIQLSGKLFALEPSNESIRILENVQHRNPANFWANHYLGVGLAAAHQPPRPSESLRYLTAAVSLRPKSIGARMNLTLALTRSGDHATALSHAKVALKLSPDYQPLQEQVAQLTAKVQAQTQAQTQPAAATSEIPTQSVIRKLASVTAVELSTIEAIESQARKLAAAGDRKAAFDLVRKAAKDFPDDPRVPRIKGVVLLELQDYVAARIVLSDAARRNPSDAASRLYHGVALQYSG